MINSAPAAVAALQKVLQKINYRFVTKVMQGCNDFYSPCWYTWPIMEGIFNRIESPYKKTIRLFWQGVDTPAEELEAEIGKNMLDGLLSTGIWREEEGVIRTNNYVLVSYMNMVVVVEQNPWYPNCTNKNTDVYIGPDSYRLGEKIPFRRGATVLDLCSGSGIQGILAARSAKKVVSVELNPKAYPVTCFNVLLNGMEDIIEVRKGDLYGVLKDGETFDCIYANPPFIPMLDTVEYPICGGGGEDGLMVMRKILEGLPSHLNRDGEVIIFCECLGDEKEVFFDSHVEAMAQKHGYSCMCARDDRVVGGCQIEGLAGLTALFNENFDSADFIAKMREIYKRLGAKYLYSLIYYLKADGGNDDNGRISYLNSYCRWHYENCGNVAEDYHVEENGFQMDYYLGDKKIFTAGNTEAQLLELLKEGHTVEQAAKWIYVKKRALKEKGIGKVSYFNYLQSMLLCCQQLEKYGLLKRVP